MATEYTSFETVLGLLAYGAVGYGAGFAVNLLAPHCDEPLKQCSDGRLWLEAGAQLGATYLVATEVMRQLMPKRDNWLPPASDASVLISAWAAAPEMRARLDELHRRYTERGRELLGLSEQAPIAVAKAPEQGAAPEQQ